MRFSTWICLWFVWFGTISAVAYGGNLYERGEHVEARVAVELHFENKVRRKAAPGETLSILKCAVGDKFAYVAEEDPKLGLIALKVPLASIRPAEMTLAMRMEEIVREIKSNRPPRALKRLNALVLIDPLDPVLGKMRSVLDLAVKSDRNLRARLAAVPTVEKEAARLERNATVAGKANALDRGSYNYRRSSYGYYYSWDGYGYTRRYRTTRVDPAESSNPGPVSDERKERSEALQADAKAMREASKQGVAEARTELGVQLEGLHQLAGTYRKGSAPAQIPGPVQIPAGAVATD